MSDEPTAHWKSLRIWLDENEYKLCNDSVESQHAYGRITTMMENIRDGKEEDGL